jgi:hypothetical protein
VSSPRCARVRGSRSGGQRSFTEASNLHSHHNGLWLTILNIEDIVVCFTVPWLIYQAEKGNPVRIRSCPAAVSRNERSFV